MEQFLPSVSAYTRGEEKGVFVADNASTDDSVAFVRANYPEIQIIRLDRNYGFAEGYNRALSQIDAEYFCLLNSDVEVSPQWADTIVSYMDSHPEVAVCQPKLLSYTDKGCFEYAGAGGGFIDKYGYPFCRGRLFSTLEKDRNQYDTIQEIFWATGACMFVRSEIYQKTGGLDGDFFAHMEEIDFCWRVKNAGYHIVCCPETTVYHLGGATLPKSSSRKTYLNFRNNWLMLYKNLPSKRLFPVFAWRLLSDLIAALHFLTDTGWQDFHAVFKAHRDFIRMLPKTRQKRKQTNPGGNTGCMYRGHIVWDYYLRKIHTFSQLDKRKFTGK